MIYMDSVVGMSEEIFLPDLWLKQHWISILDHFYLQKAEQKEPKNGPEMWMFECMNFLMRHFQRTW